MKEIFTGIWENEIKHLKKLRTFVIFKNTFKQEKFLSVHMLRKERSLFAQYRLGILPLRIETGRYRGEKEEERICMLCTRKVVENEKHFLFDCPLYYNERETLCNFVLGRYPTFNSLDVNGKLSVLMTQFIKPTARFISNAFTKRKNTLYN